MALHQLVLNGDDLALSKLYDLYGNDVIGKLKGRYPKFARRDEGYFYEAVNEAFLGYYRNPHTFDSNKSSLLRFLEIAAERDLLNILEREKKHLKTKKAPEDVELEERFWNSITKEGKSTDGQLIVAESMMLIDKVLTDHFDNELDVKLAKLILSKERETGTFSAVLQIDRLDGEKQKKEVKKHKDRIKKVIERNDIEGKLKKILQ